MEREITVEIPFKKAYCEVFEILRNLYTLQQCKILSGLLYKHFRIERFYMSCSNPEDYQGIRKEIDTNEDGSLETNYYFILIDIDVRDTSLTLRSEHKDHLEVNYKKGSDISKIYSVMKYLHKILPVALEQIKKSEQVINEHSTEFRNW